MLHSKSFQLAGLALFAAGVYGNALAEEQNPPSAQPAAEQSAAPTVEAQPAVEVKTPEQLAAEQQAAAQAALEEQERQLAAQKQAQAEQDLVAQVGELNLQLKPLVAKIYAENGFQPLWTNPQAEKEFLQQYAEMIAAGISKRSAQSLQAIENSQAGLTRDVLLTDAFLDYLYYANNVRKSAQKWLYATNAYRAAAPSNEQVQSWLSAVKNQQDVNFIANLDGRNTQYKNTLKKLRASLAKGNKNESQKLAINAQRLRILPEFTNGIFVNIPSYQLSYYRDGELVLSSRVIVGKDARRTPVMSSKLSNVVVNPPWNAPTRLINEDIIPKVRRDPSYIYRNGYTIIDSKGNSIDPYTIDWENMSSTKFPYRLRQAPGDSALGNYKFNMPSSDAIYLHDTPSRGLFGNAKRALSSGCVRVEKADQLATILLKEAGWTNEKKSSVLASKKTTSVGVRSDNPVYLYYVTMWADKNGAIHSLPDIYGYDAKNNAAAVDWALVNKYLR